MQTILPLCGFVHHWDSEHTRSGLNTKLSLLETKYKQLSDQERGQEGEGETEPYFTTILATILATIRDIQSAFYMSSCDGL